MPVGRIMHRIWVDGTEFRWTREQAAAASSCCNRRRLPLTTTCVLDPKRPIKEADIVTISDCQLVLEILFIK
jgi:hypothetical protein